ncbi:MAG: replication initiation protein, partial [Bacteroidota bacterium]
MQLPDSYKYGNIRQRVLEPAKKQFKQHTDITFNYRPIKGRGGRVIRIWFQIFENTPQQLLTNSETDDSEENELYLLVAQWISRETYDQWLKAFPFPQIKNAINYTLNQIKKGTAIENVGGYLAAMVKQTTLFDPVEQKKNLVKDKKKKEREDALYKAELDKQLTALYREKIIKENAIIARLLQEQKGLEEEIFEETKSKRFSGYNPNKSKDENLDDPIFNASFHNAVKKRFPEAFIENDAQFDPKIQEIKQAVTKI